MFKCAITGKITKAGEKQYKLTTKTKPKVYYKTVLDEKTREEKVIEIGRGFEIVKEISVSEEGLLKYARLEGI